MPISDERRGEALLVLSALAFSAMSVQVKLAGRELPVAMLVLARGVVTLVMSVTWLSLRRIRPWGSNKRGLVQRALFGTGALACYFYAVNALPLAEATVLHYLNPVFVAVIASLFLGERTDTRLVLAILLSLAGTVLVARPGFVFGGATPLSHLGVAVALGSALLSACAYATVRVLARTEHSDVIVFYFALFAAPIALPFALASWVWPSPTGWLLLLGLGVATQAGQTFMTRGLALVPAARGTTIGYVQIVFAATWGVLLFHEELSGFTLLGAGLVVLAVVLLLLQRRKPA
ncbi:MAG: DMT family transporter [Myxococcales bacterium]|nr:DMT family transporter [Myxococcales bacterium]